MVEIEGCDFMGQMIKIWSKKRVQVCMFSESEGTGKEYHLLGYDAV
jgi:hypothetical protein